jgi:SCP-2 sterol transfer family
LASGHREHIPAVTSSKLAHPDPIAQFFAILAEGHHATFAGESATLRFDIAEGRGDNGRDGAGSGKIERWRLAVSDGDVTAARQDGPADAVVHVHRPYLEEMVTGRLNAQAALLRGLLTCEGSMAALMMFQRCLPGPPGSKGRVAPIAGQTVMAQRRPQ